MAEHILPNTQSGGTYTCEGWIAHARHPMTGVLMPVKIDATPEKVPTWLPKPLRRRGVLVYVTPCGGEFQAS